MALELHRLEVGPWPMNCYLVRCSETQQVAIIDPGEDANTILGAVPAGTTCCILLTHAHPDHVGALETIREATEAPVGLHPADASLFGIEGDFPLLDGMEVLVGQGKLLVAHVPGHTPGSVCFRLNGQAVVGDAIFPGGPGYTESPEALVSSLLSLERTVFTWPDDTELLPGHGLGTTVGAERADFVRFRDQEHPAEMSGDVTWR